MAYSVFISHSTKDAISASAIADYIRKIPNLDAFLSEETVIAGNLSERLVSQIKGCDLFMVLYDTNSHSSQYVQNEIGAAITEKKSILVLALDATKPAAMLQGYAYFPLYDSSPSNSISKVYEYVEKQAKGKADSAALLTLLAFLGGLGLGYFLFGGKK
ncbi:MAG: toll/interleukin-1 receptor domain-containing protein [Candidatus Marsarchaeota archaeon]|nr:toll/interleukin-1 receptor domain-containing protein [Candidatus Marsarchaeota archaeon]